MINFWANITTGQENKISSILYKWVKVLHERDVKKSIWIEKIETTLANMEMSIIFHDITNDHKKSTLK